MQGILFDFALESLASYIKKGHDFLDNEESK